MSNSPRSCPLCTGSAKGTTYPYAIEFAGQRFHYQLCASCCSVYVDPVPDTQTFARMYAKSDYHDCFYGECDTARYEVAARLLLPFAHAGATVLDYGCGFGAFLQAVKAAGFTPYGVEFDVDAARFASENAGCDVIAVANFPRSDLPEKYDVIHLGDVLEHLPDPAETLSQLLPHLKPGGLLFVEGPLEVNPSPVYWAAHAFGTLKHVLRPQFVGQGKPTHLFRTGGSQQLAFFNQVAPALELLHWEIYETGWPYADGGVIKRLISGAALILGGKKMGGVTFGNRFTGVFRYDSGQ